MDKAYVSEFTVFMDHYLQVHPEVLEEQRRGWDFFWSPKAGLEAVNKELEDIVPDDAYGFSWSAWHTKPPDAKVH